MKVRSMSVGLAVTSLALLLAAPPAEATAFLLSALDDPETLGGLTFDSGDIVRYDSNTDVATLFFDGDLFTDDENVDAAHVLTNGNVVLSTQSAAELGGLAFGSGDLVEYNLMTDMATLFFDGSLFSSMNENVDALYVSAIGNIFLSTGDQAELGGLVFNDDDIAEYNPFTDVATLFFDESLFLGNEDIDSLHVLPNGNIVLSTTGFATLGGLAFGDGDLAEYNPVTDIATLFFDENEFIGNADIDALYVFAAAAPEPGTFLLFGSGLLGLAGVARRRRGRR